MRTDRIQINGVWYVPETKNEVIDLTMFEGCVYETSFYCFEATRIKINNSEKFYDGIDIEFTDKRVNPFKIDYWDSNEWMLGVYNNDKDSLKHAGEVMCDEGIKDFKLFLGELIKMGWLKKD